MTVITGTEGNDALTDIGGKGDTIVGLDGNDIVLASGSATTVVEGNGNDIIDFGGASSFDFVYAGDGTDMVRLQMYGSCNRVILGFGRGDMVTGSIGSDYIVTPGDHATIDGMGGGDTVVLGGHHDLVIERFGVFDDGGDHLTQVQDGLVDHIYAFNRTDRIIIEGDGKHPQWHQDHHGDFFIDGQEIAVVSGHHLTTHDLIFV